MKFDFCIGIISTLFYMGIQRTSTGDVRNREEMGTQRKAA